MNNPNRTEHLCCKPAESPISECCLGILRSDTSIRKFSAVGSESECFHFSHLGDHRNRTIGAECDRIYERDLPYCMPCFWNQHCVTNWTSSPSSCTGRNCPTHIQSSRRCHLSALQWHVSRRIRDPNMKISTCLIP